MRARPGNPGKSGRLEDLFAMTFESLTDEQKASIAHDIKSKILDDAIGSNIHRRFRVIDLEVIGILYGFLTNVSLKEADNQHPSPMAGQLVEGLPSGQGVDQPVSES